MALIVQKYGGSSVGSIERIEHVAGKAIATREAGHSVVVVVSAMKGETNRLLDLARDAAQSPSPRPRELERLGAPARCYTGAQVRILTDSAFSKARIQEIDDERIRHDLRQGRIVVVAGFQGVDENGSITTLGRGGSDTTAVALAAALKADECQIFTDVDGVYTTDPRVVSTARRLDRITFEEMLEMASLGSKVLQIRAVEFAGKYKVPLRVLSTFDEGPGTLITFEEEGMEEPLISGIAFNRDEAKLTVLGVPDTPGIAAKILGPIADANIEVDMIVQNVSNEGLTDFTFTVNRNDHDRVGAEHFRKVLLDYGSCPVVVANCHVVISQPDLRSLERKPFSDLLHDVDGLVIFAFQLVKGDPGSKRCFRVGFLDLVITLPCLVGTAQLHEHIADRYVGEGRGGIKPCVSLRPAHGFTHLAHIPVKTNTLTVEVRKLGGLVQLCLVDLERLIPAVEVPQNTGVGHRQDGCNGIQLPGFPDQVKRLLIAVLVFERHGIPVPGSDIIRAELNGFFEKFLGNLFLVLVIPQVGQRGIGFARIRVQRQCPVDCGLAWRVAVQKVEVAVIDLQ